MGKIPPEWKKKLSQEVDAGAGEKSWEKG